MAHNVVSMPKRYSLLVSPKCVDSWHLSQISNSKIQQCWCVLVDWISSIYEIISLFTIEYYCITLREIRCAYWRNFLVPAILDVNLSSFFVRNNLRRKKNGLIWILWSISKNILSDRYVCWEEILSWIRIFSLPISLSSICLTLSFPTPVTLFLLLIDKIHSTPSPEQSRHSSWTIESHSINWLNGIPWNESTVY